MVCQLCKGRKLQSFFIHPKEGEYFRCLDCDLIFLDSKHWASKEAEEHRYKLHENNLEDKGYNDFIKPFVDRLQNYLSPKSEGLDYGCGPGPLLAKLLQNKNYQMSFYDPLFFCQDHLLQKQYDFITCTEVVEHFKAPMASFCKMVSMLRPGAILAIMTSFFHKDVDFQNWHYRRDITHVCFYSSQTFTYIEKHFQLERVYSDDKRMIFFRNTKS